MSEQTMMVRLEQQEYAPGETLHGAFCLEGAPVSGLAVVEVSVLWHTEGKGDEDVGVHYFRDWQTSRGDVIDPSQPQAFSAALPRTPFSYDGLIVKVRWCVRVRARWAGFGEALGEAAFQLGRVAPLPAGDS